jgi:hypothetical protein
MEFNPWFKSAPSVSSSCQNMSSFQIRLDDSVECEIVPCQNANTELMKNSIGLDQQDLNSGSLKEMRLTSPEDRETLKGLIIVYLDYQPDDNYTTVLWRSCNNSGLPAPVDQYWTVLQGDDHKYR